MADIPITPELQPIFDVFQPFFAKLSLFAGGFLIIYLLLLIAKVYYERKKVKQLDDIKYNLDSLNAYQGIAASKDRKNWLQKLMSKDSETATAGKKGNKKFL